ncbi:Uncharacterized protein FWK35_00005879 [Aphis craccivora]|uniref:Uncharacterized protein n=1 Tax=Aphis craccivora TaxID=307492 RepID=A0A6G0Z455_APHCR|nr:Uncharacterized protein FWK35_00005879 [Aphis craccivora]
MAVCTTSFGVSKESTCLSSAMALRERHWKPKAVLGESRGGECKAENVNGDVTPSRISYHHAPPTSGERVRPAVGTGFVIAHATPAARKKKWDVKRYIVHAVRKRIGLSTLPRLQDGENNNTISNFVIIARINFSAARSCCRCARATQVHLPDDGGDDRPTVPPPIRARFATPPPTLPPIGFTCARVWPSLRTEKKFFLKKKIRKRRARRVRRARAENTRPAENELANVRTHNTRNGRDSARRLPISCTAVGGRRIARSGNAALITPNPGGGLVPVCPRVSSGGEHAAASSSSRQQRVVLLSYVDRAAAAVPAVEVRRGDSRYMRNNNTTGPMCFTAAHGSRRQPLRRSRGTIVAPLLTVALPPSPTDQHSRLPLSRGGDGDDVSFRPDRSLAFYTISKSFLRCTVVVFIDEKNAHNKIALYIQHHGRRRDGATTSH